MFVGTLDARMFVAVKNRECTETYSLHKQSQMNPNTLKRLFVKLCLHTFKSMIRAETVTEQQAATVKKSPT